MGFPKFIDREFVLDQANNLLHNDTLIIYCKAMVSHKMLTMIKSKLEYPLSHIVLSHSSDIKHNKLNDKIQIADYLELWLENQNFSDVTLIAGGKKFKAHTCILSARSPVFSAMFQDNMEEEQEYSVQFTDIDDETLRKLLQFIYSGKVENIQNSAERLLFAADKYALPNLKRLCEEALSNNLTMDNCLKILLIADRYSASVLKQDTIKFTVKHFREINAKPDFQSLIDNKDNFLSEILYAISQSKF